ncbi:hypothetical protein [Mycoplasma sp. 1654_15]|uniref:hypothetical protein n=1 Tax=Mycoplasma sp. 1654_15 TaxID=2725994 RepID=UPI0014499FBD|nr:hypothetical protein [Mycoplasma sp. 1654_15]QJB71028.1 hypothetical protein HF996_00655 [Mycoplasma sp. 1654_15]
MKKWKKFLLIFSTSISSLVTLISCNKITTEEDKKKFYEKYVTKDMVDNFDYYQKHYNLSIFWLSRDSLKFSSDTWRVNPDIRISNERKEIQRKWKEIVENHEKDAIKLLEKWEAVDKENNQKFDSFMSNWNSQNITLKSVNDFNRINKGVIEPIFQSYFEKHFKNTSIEDVFKTYNLYFIAEEYPFYYWNVNLQPQRMDFLYFGLLNKKKLFYLKNRFYSGIDSAELPAYGAAISIVAFPKSKNIEFISDFDLESIL